MSEACAVNGCGRTAKARGYCKSHYNRWKRDGDPGEVFTPRGPNPRHGTKTGYDARRCRCDECRAWKRENGRLQRARRKAAMLAGSADVPHGTAHGYSKWSCRCEPCKQVAAEYQKSWRVANPGKYSEYGRKWRQRNAASIRERAQQWREDNRVEIDQSRAEWKRNLTAVPSHGLGGYSLGCRCEDCVTTKAEYMAEWRASKTFEDIPHGTDNGYTNYGCKCDACREAHVARTTGQRRRRQVETVPTARNHGNQWTGAELEIVVTRTDLSLAELANLLGRTRYAVASARERATTDPKWVAIAGVGAAAASEDGK